MDRAHTNREPISAFARSGNGSLASEHYDGMRADLDGLGLRFDRLASELLNVRHAVAVLAICQAATFAAIVADILVRVF